MKAGDPLEYTERARYLARRLNGWANQMVVRFGEGTRVYLVGSTLTSTSPRDLDVSIVVPDHLFWRRYRDGADLDRLAAMLEKKATDPTVAVEDWNQWGTWTPDMVRYGRESASLARKFFDAWAHLGQVGGGWMMDLKIMPQSEADARHRTQPRLRIDTLPTGASDDEAPDTRREQKLSTVPE